MKSDFNRRIKTKFSDYSEKENVLSAGIYRIKMTFGKSCQQSKNQTGELRDVITVYSNEFEIKQKTKVFSSNNEVPEKYTNGSYSVKGFIESAEDLDGTNFVLKGVVYDNYICPPCPKEALCKMCTPEHLLIGDSVAVKDEKHSVIIRIDENQDNIEIFVREISPGSNCMVTMSFTSPYHIVKLQKYNKKIIFSVEKNYK